MNKILDKFLNKNNDIKNLPHHQFVETIDYTTNSGKLIKVNILSNAVDIIDSYTCNYEERMEVLEFLRGYVYATRNIDFDVKKLESEWYVHNVAYVLGVCVESAKDAGCEFYKDTRGYVNATRDVVRFLDVFKLHKGFADAYQCPEEGVILEEDTFEDLAPVTAESEVVNQVDMVTIKDINTKIAINNEDNVKNEKKIVNTKPRFAYISSEPEMTM